MGGFACGHGFLLFSSRESAVLRFMAAKVVLFSEICKKNTCRFEEFREVNILTTAKVANEMPQKKKMASMLSLSEVSCRNDFLSPAEHYQWNLRT